MVDAEMDSLFDLIGENDHEQVVFCNDKSSGLKAIIAIHNTQLGPSLGGTRMWNYASERDALVDALRLSRSMTYKASIIGLDLGGGKAVIIGDSRKDKSEALWTRYGQFVESLNGRYITAEDVGTSTADMETVAKETKHVTGLPESMGGSGDPSPFTAYGVYLGMKASAKKLWGDDNLSGKRIAVQGAGNVGRNLIKYLSEEGAVVLVSDIYEDKLEEIAKEFKVEIVGTEGIYDIDMDIYAPCALGATVDSDTVKRLKCSIIAGGANNQLADENEHADMLMEQGILFAPDFLINAGGLVNVYMQLDGYDKKKVMAHTERIYDLTLDVLNKAEEDGITTVMAAKRMAEARIEASKNNK